MPYALRPTDTPEAARERDRAARGELPERYGVAWQSDFLDRVAASLQPGISILDIGSGARPTIPREQRPADCRYVGLDISAHELARAEHGAYDDAFVGDVSQPLPLEAGSFDLVLSWQVLEHVPSLAAALANQRAALRPGGRMVAMLSGGWSIFAIAARVIPYRLSTALQTRLLGAESEDKFPTRYDQCTYRSLGTLLTAQHWSAWEVVPKYKAGAYLAFSRPLERAYLTYEDWAERTGRAQLATHYIVDATA